MFYFQDKSKSFWQEESPTFSVVPNIQQWGQTVFENCRTYDGKIFRLKSHLNRLFQSAEILSMAHPWDLEEIGNKAKEILKKQLIEIESKD